MTEISTTQLYQPCTDLSELTASILPSYLNELATSKKLKLLKNFKVSHVLGVYCYFSQLMDAIYAEELQKRNQYSKPLAVFLTSYLKASMADVDEKRILLRMIEDIFPVLYYVEKELKISTDDIDKESCRISVEDFQKFLLYLAVNLLKISEASDIPVINLKTCELKRYSRARIPLDAEDQITIERKNTKLQLEEICYFQVGSYKVLCGFFTKDGRWLSETHLDNEVRKLILKKYGLASRSSL